MKIWLQHRVLCAVVFPLFLLGSAANGVAQKITADMSVTYSRLGSKTFYREAGALNGWEGALNVQKGRFLGIEGNLAHYGMWSNDSVPRTTVLMAGPRLTANLGRLSGIHLYVHGLIGGEHSSSRDGKISGGAMTVALGGGGDFRLAPFLAWRVSADYLTAPGNSPANGGHNRISTGLVVRF